MVTSVFSRSSIIDVDLEKRVWYMNHLTDEILMSPLKT